MYQISNYSNKIKNSQTGVIFNQDQNDQNYQSYLVWLKKDNTPLFVDFFEDEFEEANKAKVPTQARSMNLRLVLIQNGISIQDVYDAIASLPTPQNELAYQMFEYATHYDRNNQMLNTLAQMMNISQEQLDEFFIQAENLVI